MALSILPRSAWTSTSNARARDALTASRVIAITVHYPVGPDTAGYSQTDVAAYLGRIRQMHLNRAWKDIGYNYAVDQAGRVWFLTGDVIGAHSGTIGNPSSLGVVFILGTTETPTPAAIAAFRSLRAEKIKKYPKATKVQGHQQVPGNSTACPGKPLMALIKSGSLVSAAPPAPAPVPPKPAPAIAEATVLTLNAAAKSRAWQRATWKARLPELAKIINDSGADIVAVQEAGSIGYVKALDARIRRFKRSPGKGAPLFNRWRYLYHNPLRYRCLKSGLMTLNKVGTKHAAWGLYQDIATGKELFVTSVHLSAGGTSTDKARLSEARVLIAKTKTLNTTGAPVVHPGDFNSAGKVGTEVMRPAGFKDTLDTADVTKNAHLDSNPGWNVKAKIQLANDKTGWHLDHIYAEAGIDTRTWELIRAIEAGDHDAIKCTIRF